MASGVVHLANQTARDTGIEREPPTDTRVLPASSRRWMCRVEAGRYRRRMSRTSSARSWPLYVHPVDVAVALGLAGLSFLPYLSGSSELVSPGWLSALLLLLESLPLVVRRHYPLAVLLVIVGATIVQIALIPPGGALTGGLGLLVAVYTVGERLDRLMSLGLTALTAAIVAALFIGRGGLPDALPSLIQTELILGVAWLLGDAARIRRLYTDSLVEHARLVESEREERTRRAVLEERERIARELHDVVAHHVSVIVIQAGGGLSAIERRPEDARSALESIATTGRQALTEMRRMLGVLGQGEPPGPMPGLELLDDLLAHVRGAGLAVELSVEGDRRPLDPGVELSAFRIVQEALTNSLKHAGGGRARVTLSYEPGALVISVDDVRGPGQQPVVEPVHAGRGLVGMRERVAMLRGTMDARPTDSGFRVTARLPLEVSPVP
jgi:signal transduction histidine kinase